MLIRPHKRFQKSFKKQSAQIQESFFSVMETFIENPFDPIFNNHALSGDLRGIRSINVTGDVRVHYKETEEGVLLMKIGTHAQLYG